MYGFTIGTNGSIKEKWSDNTYSKMTVIGPDDEEGYEETIEYTQDGKPAHFRSYGPGIRTLRRQPHADKQLPRLIVVQGAV